MRLITVATCQLNQWALDFDGNLERVRESCILAKKRGATYRLGPELELCGYGCEDHYYEGDTIEHCWESLLTLLQDGCTQDLLCDFGMPVMHKSARYNCRVVCCNGKILWIRPKTAMADNGNYRESRYFTAYNAINGSSNNNKNEVYLLPPMVSRVIGQTEVPFGLGYVQSTLDSVLISCESCEELWTPRANHIDLALQGVHIVGNGSGSHHELRKLEKRIQLIQSATSKCGGIYLYANQCGCDGGRLYYDGCSMIVVNGNVICQAPQFDVQDVTVLTATVDIEEVESYRSSLPSLGVQMANSNNSTATISMHCIPLNDAYLTGSSNKLITPPLPDGVRYHTPEEECCLGPACWLWDYLRRSGASGFLLPLSGGADSSSVAAIVGVMTTLVFESITSDKTVASDVRRICKKSSEKDWLPSSPQELANFVLHTVYMGTENSSFATRSRAERLSQNDLGAYHLNIEIDGVVASLINLFHKITGKTPQFESRGGTMTEDLALQNIQARLRMVMAYFLAQLLPWVRGTGGGFLLVLGSANVDEALRGYMTKYDCSSADLNPIGAISKTDLKRMLLHLGTNDRFPVLAEIAAAPPTAELRPNSGKGEHSQLDEEEMGMTYSELSWFGRLRKLSRCGPVAMYLALSQEWRHLKPSLIAEKVQRFFKYYAMNRHKLCTLTPSYHAEGYSPDDNRFDLRPFLYPVRWKRQFTKMNELAAEHEKQQEQKDAIKK